MDWLMEEDVLNEDAGGISDSLKSFLAELNPYFTDEPEEQLEYPVKKNSKTMKTVMSQLTANRKISDVASTDSKSPSWITRIPTLNKFEHDCRDRDKNLITDLSAGECKAIILLYCLDHIIYSKLPTYPGGTLGRVKYIPTGLEFNLQKCEHLGFTKEAIENMRLDHNYFGVPEKPLVVNLKKLDHSNAAVGMKVLETIFTEHPPREVFNHTYDIRSTLAKINPTIAKVSDDQYTKFIKSIGQISLGSMGIMPELRKIINEFGPLTDLAEIEQMIKARSTHSNAIKDGLFSRILNYDGTDDNIASSIYSNDRIVNRASASIKKTEDQLNAEATDDLRISLTDLSQWTVAELMDTLFSYEDSELKFASAMSNSHLVHLGTVDSAYTIWNDNIKPYVLNHESTPVTVRMLILNDAIPAYQKTCEQYNFELTDEGEISTSPFKPGIERPGTYHWVTVSAPDGVDADTTLDTYFEKYMPQLSRADILTKIERGLRQKHYNDLSAKVYDNVTAARKLTTRHLKAAAKQNTIDKMEQELQQMYADDGTDGENDTDDGSNNDVAYTNLDDFVDDDLDALFAENLQENLNMELNNKELTSIEKEDDIIDKLRNSTEEFKGCKNSSDHLNLVSEIDNANAKAHQYANDCLCNGRGVDDVKNKLGLVALERSNEFNDPNIYAKDNEEAKNANNCMIGIDDCLDDIYADDEEIDVPDEVLKAIVAFVCANNSDDCDGVELVDDDCGELSPEYMFASDNKGFSRGCTNNWNTIKDTSCENIYSRLKNVIEESVGEMPVELDNYLKESVRAESRATTEEEYQDNVDNMARFIESIADQFQNQF